MTWIPVSEMLPDNGQLVDTCIQDGCDPRNVQLLVRKGKLWYFDDMSMYVYYTPTHWRPIK